MITVFHDHRINKVKDSSLCGKSQKKRAVLKEKQLSTVPSLPEAGYRYKFTDKWYLTGTVSRKFSTVISSKFKVIMKIFMKMINGSESTAPDYLLSLNRNHSLTNNRHPNCVSASICYNFFRRFSINRGLL